jgi:hypothetical protein
MPCEFGNIIPVPLPFPNQTAFKKRAAVTISGLSYNRNYPDIIVSSDMGPIRQGL